MFAFLFLFSTGIKLLDHRVYDPILPKIVVPIIICHVKSPISQQRTNLPIVAEFETLGSR